MPGGHPRRRRRRGDSDAVTVAELTGEIPVVRDDDDAEHGATDTIEAVEPADSPTEDVAAEPVTEDKPKTAYWSEPEPRCPSRRRSPSGCRAPSAAHTRGPWPTGPPGRGALRRRGHES
ncbi:putative transmembrane protein [Mycobacterium intracellulare 1956]|uniref:Putative transmembrane protein n=1 Tax=Mycobacterium intracellulare 1956 TaxID=1299331 RepID=X8CBA2_MYCIT|nr:putative transmembrane protein [Mycobacterium intracellulare 1956]